MASRQPDQNHPIDIEEGPPSSQPGGGNHHQQNSAPDPETGYPPATGYPPTMGYPAYQYNLNYNYGAPPKKQTISGFLRGIIGVLIFFFLLGCIIVIITWLVLHPTTPIFHVNNVTVSDFNISSSSLTANWVANFSARNPNEKLEIDFDEIDVYMVYHDEYLVGSSSIEPFAMKKKQNATMVAKLSAANNRSEREMGKMATERNLTGKVSFELRMMVLGTYKAGNWWARHFLIKVFCENLQIGFLNNSSTNGSLANANSLPDCLISV